MQLAHQFQGQMVKGEGYRWRGYAVSAKTGGHSACQKYTTVQCAATTKV